MTDQQIKKYTDILAGHQNICAAFLLGSAARGQLRPDSDIDLAILPMADSHVDIAEQAELAAQIEAAAGRQTDIGIIDSHNLIYAREAYLKGICVFCRDQYQKDLFGANALGLYLELREERKEIEDAYRAG